VILPHEGEFLMRTRTIGGRIEGTTVDEHGDPVALVVVAGGENYTHSFGDGHFVLENFRGKVVTLTCTHADYLPVTVTNVADGATGVVARLERRQPMVNLEVHDAATSAPILHTVVEFVIDDPAARPDPTSPHHLSTDGRFPIRVPAGVSALDVSAAGYERKRVSLAAPVDGETVRVVLAKSP